MSITTIGIIIALISTASWALCTTLLKKFGEKLEPIGMTTYKTILSFIILAVIIFLTGETFDIGFSNIFKIALSGILGIAIGDSLFFASLNRLSPLVLSIILFVGPDLFSGIFGFVFLNEMPSLYQWIGIFCILTGLFLFMLQSKNNDNDDTTRKTTFIGLIFAILSLVCTAIAMVIIKPVLINVPVITATMYRMFFSAIVLLIFGVFSKKVFKWKNILSDKKYNLKLSGTLALATIGGFWLSLVAIKYCKLIIASTVMSLEPLFILIFMILFYKYIPNKKEIFGIFIIITGIIFICLR